ncbi:MAG TPA: HAD hydrolase-like protein [Candidatus Saccharimonadales bacterium]|nr:HAD hydrolase-like protein [Candidatus Saccharimonadales bacterium]
MTNSELPLQKIVWDLDGTIVDSFSIHEAILEQVLPVHDLELPPREELLAHFHGQLHESIGGLLGARVSEAQLQQIIKDFLVVDDAYITHPDDHFFRDAVDLANRAYAQGIEQLVVTNRAHGVDRGNASPRTMLQNSALRHMINRVICGDEGEHRKPAAAVLQGVDFDPGTTLVVGDQFVDARFACNLGARAVLVCRHDAIPHLEQLPEGWQASVQIVHSLDEVQL